MNNRLLKISPGYFAGLSLIPYVRIHSRAWGENIPKALCE
jgi:hypothetical protein